MKVLNAQSTDTGEGTPDATPEGLGSARQRQAAFWVFVGSQIVVFAGLLWNFHGRWFIADEWAFLATRTAGNIDSLFRPYSQHWSTLPILYYRLLWNLVGIRSYLPYLVSVLTLHVAIASLLRGVMIRARVLPWLATLGAVVFSVYGAGYADISYAFNIGFDGSVLFGLVFLIAVDHPGPVGRRDWLGVLAGLAGLLCSGIGVAMVVAVAVAIVVRHGVRRSLLLVTPLAGIYLIWFATVGHGAFTKHASLPAVIRFVVLGAAFTVSSLGHSPVVGVALTVLLAVGVVVTVRSTPLTDLRVRYAAPAAMLVGAAAFLVISGFGRADNGLPSSDTYAASRYLYVTAALLLPALIVAASQLVTTWRALWPVVVVVLVVGVPGNIMVMHRSNYLHTLDGYRQMFLTIPRLPIASALPRSLHPDPDFDGWVTLGWLLDGVRNGRIPPPSPPASAAQKAFWTLRLAWQPATTSSSGSCHPVDLPAVIEVQSGTRMTVEATVTLRYLYRPHKWSAPLGLSGSPRSTYRTYWPMTVRISPTGPGQMASVCTR